jgi:hypothetical protein
MATRILEHLDSWRIERGGFLSMHTVFHRSLPFCEYGHVLEERGSHCKDLNS